MSDIRAKLQAVIGKFPHFASFEDAGLYLVKDDGLVAYSSARMMARSQLVL